MRRFDMCDVIKEGVDSKFDISALIVTNILTN